MLFAIITLITALAMAGTAAWFAIVGIMAIFAGLPTYALVMGSVIELGKVVGVSWLYRNWQEPTKLKYAMLPLVLIAMLLTSMGIFGLLSKAHLEQAAPVSNNIAIIERLDQRIEREERQIQDAEQVIGQLDETVQTLIDYDRVRGPTGAIATRESQQEQRENLRTIIDEAQSRIDTFEDEKLELTQELQKIELEVGPIKYIAEIVYSEGGTRIEDAVRWVIVAFIFVFDPMAILLLMAANYTLMSRKPPEPDPTPEPVFKDEPPKSNEPTMTFQSFKPNSTATFHSGEGPAETKSEEATEESKPKKIPNHGMNFDLLKRGNK